MWKIPQKFTEGNEEIYNFEYFVCYEVIKFTRGTPSIFRGEQHIQQPKINLAVGPKEIMTV